MKKFVVLGATCFCALAQAQQSITLYGVADINVEYVNRTGVVPQASNRFNSGSGHSVVRENSGGYSGSRWGLRGTEDLGGGIKSLFVLENGFSLDNGSLNQGGRMFGRQAFIGLDTNIGQFTFGRQNTSMFVALANFVPAKYANQYEPVGIIAGANYRQDNVVKYVGNFGPLTALAHWSFGVGTSLPQTDATVPGVGDTGEVPGKIRRDSAYGVALTYSTGPLGLGIAYDQWNPTITGTTELATFKKAAVMGRYAINKTTSVMGGYRWGKNNDQNGSVMLRDDFFWIGAQFQVTPAVDLVIEYDYQNVKNVGGNTDFQNPWQVALIADYTLSKRTDIYLTTAYSRNAGLTLDSAANGYLSSLALGNPYILSNGQKSMFGAALGIRHKF